MLLRLPYFLVILLLISGCNKEFGFKEDKVYVLDGSGTYIFDSQSYSKVTTVKLILLENNKNQLTFESFLVNNFDTTITNFLVLEINKNNDVIGSWLSEMEFYPDWFFEGEIVKKNGAKVISGEMSFTCIHEYLIYDGPFIYPGSALVTAKGPFEISLE